jgi:hypothetical protein
MGQGAVLQLAHIPVYVMMRTAGESHSYAPFSPRFRDIDKRHAYDIIHDTVYSPHIFFLHVLAVLHRIKLTSNVAARVMLPAYNIAGLKAWRPRSGPPYACKM